MKVHFLLFMKILVYGALVSGKKSQRVYFAPQSLSETQIDADPAS